MKRKKNGKKIEYPTSDDIRMAETAINIRAIIDLWEVLGIFLKNRADVFIYVDTFWYSEQGNVSARITPDVLVVTGMQPSDIGQRPCFFSWEEKTAVPAAVFEFASENTWRPMKGKKFKRYEATGAREYFLVDLENKYLDPPLQGYRLKNAFQAIEHQGTLVSNLGLGMRIEKYRLRLIDALTNEPILNYLEAIEKARARTDEVRAQADEFRAQADEFRAKADQARRDAKRYRRKAALLEQRLKRATT